MIYLAPTDFTPEATAAVVEAARRASISNAELLLLHVYSAPGRMDQIGTSRGFPNVDDELRASAEEEVAEQAKAIAKPGLQIRCLTRCGVPSEEICAVAAEEDVDMILMAMHSGRKLRHLLLGSTTDKVVRSAPCSVLVYRRRAD